MGSIHYQTLEAVKPRELQVLQAIKERFNAGKDSSERIKLWRKDDILTCLEPREARWGFSRVHDGGKERLFRTLELMSAATPRLTWIVYDEDGLGEFTLKGGKLEAER